MKTLENMNKEELLEVVKIKDDMIKELKTEIELYQKLIEQIKQKK